MRTWVIAAIALLVALAGAAWLLLDWLVKSSIESRGSAITGTRVTVAGVRISLGGGHGTLSGFVIGNPEGFASPEAFRADAISITIEPAALWADVPVVREIVIDAPEVTYEHSGNAGNYEVLQRHIGTAVQGENAPPRGDKGAPKAAKRYLIERILIRRSRVRIVSPLLKGGAASFVLPDVELRGLGSGGHGVTAAEAAKQVVAAMATKVAINAALSGDVLKKGLDSALDSLLHRRK
jgi:hypothetical protein